MHERAFEILVRHCAEEIFGAGWRLIAQQLSLPSGRLDLLFSDAHRQRHLVELKKGRANVGAIDQALGYSEDLSRLLDGAILVPWVVAHEIPDRVTQRAESMGVRTRAVSFQECEILMGSRGLGEKELLGDRRAVGILHGGAGKGGVWRDVENGEAYTEMPQQVVVVLRRLEKRSHFLVRSGAMQTVLHYRGVKLGGVNRKHRGGCGYISEGVVLRSEFATFLRELGFQRMTKTQGSGTHEHIWWEIPFRGAEGFERAVIGAQDVVDRSLEIASGCVHGMSVQQIVPADTPDGVRLNSNFGRHNCTNDS